MPISSLDAVEQILKKAGEPLHYEEITRRALEKGLWATRGKTPAATINARLCDDLNRWRESSRFVRCGPGVFGLQGAGHSSVSSRASGSAPTSSDSIQPRRRGLTSLEKEIEKVRNDYSENQNESDVRRFAVEPILKRLGWDSPKVMKTELPVGPDAGRKKEMVDIALRCRGRNQVMVEVKFGPLSRSHREQLRKYCRLEEVSLGVLTNGQIWELYYGMNTGMKDNRAEVIDISQADLHTVGRRMERFLSKGNIESGEARKVFRAAREQRVKAPQWDKVLQGRWGEVLRTFESQLEDALEKSVKSAEKTIPRSAVQEFVQKKIGTGKAQQKGASPKQRAIPNYSSKKREISDTMKNLLRLLENEPSATLERIAEVLGMSSRGGAYSVCKSAEARGYIVKDREGRARMYTVTRKAKEMMAATGAEKARGGR